MIFQTLNALFLVAGLVFQTTAPVPESPVIKEDTKIAPELKQNAVKLLSSVAREAGQLNLAENRVRARTIIADLMWQHDEPAARVVYQNAFTELRNLLGEINAARLEEMSGDEKNNHYNSRFRVGELRREYVLTLAAHDSAAAIEALPALETKKIEGWDPLAERLPELKLETALVLAVKDANRAYAIYKEEIAAGGITVPLVESFDKLHRQNPELTAKIARDIFVIFKTVKIGERSSAENATKINAASSKQAELEFWQATIFLNAASKLKRRAERDKTSLAPLTDAELRELAERLALAFLTAPNPGENTINTAMTAITLYAPEQVRRIRRKVGAEGVRGIERVMESDAYYLSLEENDADELKRAADRAADPNHRDLLYAEAARKALEETPPEKARMIAALIKKRENYSMLIQEIEIAVPLAVARRGKPAEVRRMLVRLKTKEERMAVLLELASALAAKGDREAAKKLLGETVDMLFTARPDSSPDSSDLESGLELVGKFAAVSFVVAPDETFTNIEQMVESFNSEIKRDVIFGNNSLKAKEMFYDSMERQLSRHLPNSIDLLKSLASADFERTVKLVDKFERPEIRLLARLRLVQALLDAEASEKERELRKQVESEDLEP